ncbi:MAG: dATP pyrophosphohydrolase [Psychromonas sp.]|jgi:dATP pyrophosphohydrolase|uniref:NUDIX hydrolase n=1 Tax=Psychromonas sp. TaxID=1884585 RepID=UPI0039E24FEA
MRQPFSVNVFLYKRVAGEIEYLMLKRVPRTDLKIPGFWQCVSGALEKDEGLVKAAQREVFEETGLLIETLTATGFKLTYPIKDAWRVLYGPDPKEVIECVFFSEIQTDPVLSDEHCAFEWLPYQQAYARLTFGDYQQAIESVNNMLKAEHRKA